MDRSEGRPRPYVGVSGVVRNTERSSSGIEVQVPQQLFVEAHAQKTGLFDTGRMLALGVKATHKTQFEGVENKYGREWYPVGDELSVAMRRDRQHPDVIGVAQTYLDIHHAGDAAYRQEFMDRLMKRGQGMLQAVQFDMLLWHENDEMLEFVADVREKYDVKILLQCYKRAMDELGPKQVAQKLGRYASGIDYVLFDASHGTGVRMDAERLGTFLEEAYSSSELESVNFAVAGGLNAQNVRDDLPELVVKYPDVSWDAEGQLHPLNNLGKRPLQMDRVKDYLQASTSILNR